MKAGGCPLLPGLYPKDLVVVVVVVDCQPAWYNLSPPSCTVCRGHAVAAQVRGISFQGAGVTGGSMAGDLKMTGHGRAQLMEA